MRTSFFVGSDSSAFLIARMARTTRIVCSKVVDLLYSTTHGFFVTSFHFGVQFSLLLFLLSPYLNSALQCDGELVIKLRIVASVWIFFGEWGLDETKMYVGVELAVSLIKKCVS